ncbi:hypothetical protein ACFSQJ_01560 [Croceitalea marina]|uniref:Lipocalin-like domain-containing protein n=1 Tax=Croceitalea marina TaxID=1775166 RepID=A0ABW5MQU9_9FLAO
MKKNVFLFLCLISLFSCNLDDGVDGITPPNFAAVGLWDLSEVVMNPPQDLNDDGISSTNLLDELDCLTGELLIDGDLQWSLEQTDLAITAITGGQFDIRCNGIITESGIWFSDETEVTFEDNPQFSTLQIEDGNLVLNLNQDLPGFQKFVYTLR